MPINGSAIGTRLGQVIPFKRDVYRQAMMELAPALRWFGPMAC